RLVGINEQYKAAQIDTFKSKLLQDRRNGVQVVALDQQVNILCRSSRGGVLTGDPNCHSVTADDGIANIDSIQCSRDLPQSLLDAFYRHGILSKGSRLNHAGFQGSAALVAT